MARPVLKARTRKERGKGAARKLRRAHQIPAVFYGPKREPVPLVMDYPSLERILRQSTGENIILDLEVQEDGGTQTWRAILKELQMDPVKDTCLHADFYEISMDQELTVQVPIQLVNTPEGVSEGGILQHVRREVTVSCLPDKLIDVLELDVSGLKIGEALHIRDIELPEGMRALDEEHLTVAVVAAPAIMPEEVEEEVLEEEALEAEGVEAEVVEEAEAKPEGSKEPSSEQKGGEGKS